jgi:serine/threonine-protein kinase
MGTVYEAVDPVLHRKVAVKTMIPGLGESPELHARFLREAQAAGGLRHRNIVTVYDLGEDNGQPFIAMELVEGTDLEKILTTGAQLSIEWILDVLRQICEGLGYAHDRGIIHRDVKPANIIVTPDGDVKIMDFGIAHLQSSDMTKSGPVLGTIHYMAPEQLEGLRIDRRADVFSVGAIVYELLARRKPFDGESLTNVMYKITHEDADPAPLPRTAYSPKLEDIVIRALARDVEARYQSLEELREDLEWLVRETATRLLGLTGEPTGAGAAVMDAPAPVPVSEEEERRREEMRAEIVRAREQGQLQKALELCRRLLDLLPEDEELAQTAGDIAAAIQDREVEQLCGVALDYAASGELELAEKIAARIAGLAPWSPNHARLREYLDEERARRLAMAMPEPAVAHEATASDAEAPDPILAARAIAGGADGVVRPSSAWQAAVAALNAANAFDRVPPPDQTPAFDRLPPPDEIPEPESAVEPELAPPDLGPPDTEPPDLTPPRVVSLDDVAAPAIAPSVSAPAAVLEPNGPAVSDARGGDGGGHAPSPWESGRGVSTFEATPQPADELAPLPEGRPADPEAARLLDAARWLLRDRLPGMALDLLERAASLEPQHPAVRRILADTRIEARREEVESLTSAALGFFVDADYRGARRAAGEVLALDPANRKARELLDILESLGTTR